MRLGERPRKESGETVQHVWEALQVGDRFGASKILQWDSKRCQSYSQSPLLCKQFEALTFSKCVCVAINGRVRMSAPFSK